jgi:hypothetical protein
MSIIICPVCQNNQPEESKFCTECGCNLSQAEAVKVTPSIEKDKIVSNLRSRFQGLGQKAQKGITDASSVVIDRAYNVSTGTDNDVVQQKVSEAVASLVNMMVNVARDVKIGMTTDVVKAVDLSARVSFVAFSVGVSIDLASLKENIDTSRMQPNEDRVP